MSRSGPQCSYLSRQVFENTKQEILMREPPNFLKFLTVTLGSGVKTFSGKGILKFRLLTSLATMQ